MGSAQSQLEVEMLGLGLVVRNYIFYISTGKVIIQQISCTSEFDAPPYLRVHKKQLIFK